MTVNKATRISIAMAVYNEERFIQEQLDSFVRQTRLPDELVVSDDASTDRSVEIVREFTAHAPFSVRLYINDHNLGIDKNFERGISACAGDIIFFSDFDDVWYPEKLAVMERALKQWPEAGVAVCDADLVDDHLCELGSRLWQTYHFNPGITFRNNMARGRLFKRATPMHGCCMAIRANLKPLIMPIPDGRSPGEMVYQRRPRKIHWDSFIGWTGGYSGAAAYCWFRSP